MAFSLPDGFVYLRDVAPTIVQDMRYAGSDNFIGRPIKGYLYPECLLTRPAAKQLAIIQMQLHQQGMSLKVWDCYRPQRAVDDFYEWSLNPKDALKKAEHYPNIPKDQLFTKGYIIRRSGHSRGSTMDLTVIRIDKAANKHIPGKFQPNGDIEMGTPFDWFDKASNTDYPHLPDSVKANRQWFKNLMQKHHFTNLSTEWWHYTLTPEPFPDQYFDFPIVKP